MTRAVREPATTKADVTEASQGAANNPPPPVTPPTGGGGGDEPPPSRAILEGNGQHVAEKLGDLSRWTRKASRRSLFGLVILLDFRSFRGLGERSCWSAVTAVVYVSGEVVGVSA